MRMALKAAKIMGSLCRACLPDLQLEDSPMSDSPISIACSNCTNQIQRTYEQLKADGALECPACGHKMTAERSAVVQHVEAIRDAVAAVAK